MEKIKPNTFIGGIEITNKKFKRVKTNEEILAFIADPELGLYKSIVELADKDYDISNLGELQLMQMNPTRFIPLD